VLWLGELRQYAEADDGAEVPGAWPTYLTMTVIWSSPPCGPSTGPPIAAARAWPGPGRLDRPGCLAFPADPGEAAGQGEAAASLAEGTVMADPDGSTLADLTVD